LLGSREVSERIDLFDLAGLGRGGDDRPVFGTLVGSGKLCVLAIERDATDRSFDRIVAELDAAVFGEARQSLPAGSA